MALSDRYLLVPVCPEQLGGLPTPRPPAEIRGGDGFDVIDGNASVVAVTGEDVTEPFIRGARAVARASELTGAKAAVLKARSPSCGSRRTYDGTFSGSLREGPGVTAALLITRGLEVVSEERLSELPGSGNPRSGTIY